MQTGKADIHIHTIFSDGLMSPEALLEFVVSETDLDVIAVTDHDTVTGARVAQAYAEHFHFVFRPIEVVIGAEITSADGDILALYIEDDVPAGKTAAETVALIHAQGGLAIAAHPFSHAPLLLHLDGMKGVQRLIETVPFDGVEVRNGTPTELLSNPLTRWHNRRAQRLSETGGSDGHYLPTIGKTYTRFPGTTANALREAILTGTTSAGGRIYNPFLVTRLLHDLVSRQLPVHRLPAARASWPMFAMSQK